jgi:hypothetical protein
MKSKFSITLCCLSLIGLCGFVVLTTVAHEGEDAVKKPVAEGTAAEWPAAPAC